MKNEPLPPDPVAVDGSGVRDVPSERAVAKLAQRAARTSGWGLAFVALDVAAAVATWPFVTQANSFASLVPLLFLLLVAIFLLGLGLIFGLVAWRQQTRLGVSCTPGVLLSLFAPLSLALAIAVLVSRA